jgi:thiol-disulfide isomerase/thioredoxin
MSGRPSTAPPSGSRPVLIIFGANWCKDCRALDAALKAPANAELIGKEFVVVKVDVGNFDRHLDIAERYGNPIKKGIPAASVLSPKQELLYRDARRRAGRCAPDERDRRVRLLPRRGGQRQGRQVSTASRRAAR